MRGQRTWGMWTPGSGGQSAAPGTSRGPRLVTPGTRVSFQQNQSGNSLSGAKKVCDKIWPKLQLKVLFMAKFALNKSC